MMGLTKSFTLDLRSIALFRIMLGMTMLYDLFNRFPYIELYLSDQGVFSRADLLSVVDRPWSFSIYMLFGDPLQIQFFFLIHILAAIFLLIGFHTRAAIFISWIMILSMQHRNPLILNGGDTLLSIFTFWALFLPLNARWSFDAHLRKQEQKTDNSHLSVQGICFFVQVLFVYIFSVSLKNGDLWKSGEAVKYAIHNIGLIKEPALWIQVHPELHTPLTYLTYHWEWFGCILLLIPVFNSLIRVFVIFGYILMHVAFALTLDLALFPLVSITGWLALLPSLFWTRITSCVPPKIQETSLSKTTLMGSFTGGKIMTTPRIAGYFCALILISIYAWNLKSIPNSPFKNIIPKFVENTLYTFKLRQKWSMFAANPPSVSTWYSIEAQQVNGDTIDLFHPQVPYTLREPKNYVSRFPDRRWNKYLGNLRKKKYESLRKKYLHYFVQRWNQRVGFENKIQKANLIFFKKRISFDLKKNNSRGKVLETYWSKETAQIRKKHDEKNDEVEDI